MENECEALPGVAYPGVWDNRSTINTKTGYDADDDVYSFLLFFHAGHTAELPDTEAAVWAQCAAPN